jgi:hypothetical protein
MLLDSSYISQSNRLFQGSMRPSWANHIHGKSLLNGQQVTTNINSNGQYIDRIVNVGDSVDVYRNLNKPEYFSCKAQKGSDKGKVVCYGKIIVLGNASFKVVESSRQRVLKSARNVHAFCTGSFLDCFDGVFMPDETFTRLTYHPRKNDFFYERETGLTIPRDTTATIAVLWGSDVYVSYNT